MDNSIFSPLEQELLDAARMVLSEGVTRLMGRQSLLPARHGRQVRDECRAARDALTVHLCATYGHLRHEVAVVALIDAQGRLIAIEEFPRGKATHCEVSGRVLAEYIIKHGAALVLLAHNHPSGDNTPSQPDVALTRHLVEWLKPLECVLLDHLVLNSAEASAIIGEW